MPKAMNIPDSKAAVDKEWKKGREVASVASDKSEVRKRGHRQSTKRGIVDFSRLIVMDVCHLKNSELEKQLPRVYSEVMLKILGLMQYSRNRDLQHLK